MPPRLVARVEALREPGAARYCETGPGIVEMIKEEMKSAALGALALLVIHFLKYGSDCTWPALVRAVCAMAAREAILGAFLLTEESGKFVCSSRGSKMCKLKITRIKEYQHKISSVKTRRAFRNKWP